MFWLRQFLWSLFNYDPQLDLKIKAVISDVIINSTGTDNFTAARDCSTFNEKKHPCISLHVFILMILPLTKGSGGDIYFSLQRCLPLSSDAWVVSKYLIIFYCTAEDRGNGADPSRAVSYFYNITTPNGSFSKYINHIAGSPCSSSLVETGLITNAWFN